MRNQKPNPEIEEAARMKRVRREARDARWLQLNQEGQRKSLLRLQVKAEIEREILAGTEFVS